MQPTPVPTASAYPFLGVAAPVGGQVATQHREGEGAAVWRSPWADRFPVVPPFAAPATADAPVFAPPAVATPDAMRLDGPAVAPWEAPHPASRAPLFTLSTGVSVGADSVDDTTKAQSRQSLAARLRLLQRDFDALMAEHRREQRSAWAGPAVPAGRDVSRITAPSPTEDNNPTDSVVSQAGGTARHTAAAAAATASEGSVEENPGAAPAAGHVHARAMSLLAALMHLSLDQQDLIARMAEPPHAWAVGLTHLHGDLSARSGASPVGSVLAAVSAYPLYPVDTDSAVDRLPELVGGAVPSTSPTSSVGGTDTAAGAWLGKRTAGAGSTYSSTGSVGAPRPPKAHRTRDCDSNPVPAEASIVREYRMPG